MLVEVFDFCFGWVFRLLFSIVEAVVLWGVPIMRTKAVLSNPDELERNKMMKKYLNYWIVVSLLLSLEYMTFGILSLVPFYGFIRLVFLGFAQLDDCHLSQRVLSKIIPFVEDNEEMINEVASGFDEFAQEHIPVVREKAGELAATLIEKSAPYINQATVEIAKSVVGVSSLTGNKAAENSSDAASKSSASAVNEDAKTDGNNEAIAS